MSKTANVYARVEPDLKAQAEAVLEQLGLPMSNAITLFLHQIVLQRGLPFDVRVPNEKPLCWGALTAEEQDAALEQPYQNALRGEGISADTVFSELEAKYGL